MLYDLHVHSDLPVLGSSFRRWVHGLNFDQETGFFIVTFYDIPFPSRKAGYRRLLGSIESFVREHLDDIHIGRGKRVRKFAISIESARLIPGPEAIEKLYQLGVRSIQPLHFFDNQYGHSCGEGLWPVSAQGLTRRGQEFLKEMDRYGMILDFAHMNAPTMADALAAYSGPVMCSHTGLFSLKKNERNLREEIAREIFKRKGVIGVMPWRAVLAKPHWSANQWQDRYAEVLTRLIELGGERGVCIGSDRGAPLWIPRWFYRKNGLQGLREALIRQGYSEKVWTQICFTNAMEFLTKVLGGSGLPILPHNVTSTGL